MPDWRNPDDYAYTGTLTAPQWAWEFLRRNGDYRREWAVFHATWQALEADYGRPPERDFPRWKEDPRAYVVVSEENADGCRVDQDKVLIECALGARWGFYKFPPDPALTALQLGDGLTWREETRAALYQQDKPSADDPACAVLTFDLRLPLKEQLEQARRSLIVRQRRRERDGALVRSSVAKLRGVWMGYLRCLDAVAANDDVLAVAMLCDGDAGAFAAQLAAAQALCAGGYRALVGLPEK